MWRYPRNCSRPGSEHKIQHVREYHGMKKNNPSIPQLPFQDGAEDHSPGDDEYQAENEQDRGGRYEELDVQMSEGSQRCQSVLHGLRERRSVNHAESLGRICWPDRISDTFAGWNAFTTWLANQSAGNWDCSDARAVAGFFKDTCVLGWHSENGGKELPSNLHSLCKQGEELEGRHDQACTSLINENRLYESMIVHNTHRNVHTRAFWMDRDSTACQTHIITKDDNAMRKSNNKLRCNENEYDAS